MKTPTRNFTKVPHGCLETLAAMDMPSSAWQILMYLFRQTFGWQREWHQVERGQLAKALDLNFDSLAKGLNHLFDENILLQEGPKYALNDIEDWGNHTSDEDEEGCLEWEAPF